MPAADDPQSLVAGWSKGTFHRVYLLAGPDALTKEETFQRLKAKFIGDDPGGMNTDGFDGADASAGAILAAAGTLPFFGGRRLIVVRRAQELSTAETNRLADGIAGLPDCNCLVLLWDDKADNRTVLVQAVRSAGAVAVFWPPFENQLPGWIVERAAAQGKKMGLPAARALLETVGPSLPDLSQEVAKLALYAKDRADLTAEDVAAVSTGGRAGFHFMEWERVLWSRDRTRALGVLEEKRGQGEAAEALLPQFIKAVQRLALAKALFAEKRPRLEIFEKLWIRLRDVQADLEAAQARWSWGDVRNALERLLQADVAVKSGRTGADAELTRLTIALTEENAPLRRR